MTQTHDNAPIGQKDGQRRSKKPSGGKKLVGHEVFLKNLETTGSEIKVQTSAGETFIGTVRRSDAYTISIQVKGELTPKVFFKHCIEFFQPTQLPHDGLRSDPAN